MEFNKSLLMPVCIMVKILKSGVDFMGCGLSFDLLGISPTSARCRQPGAPRKPTLRRGRDCFGGVVLGRGGEGWESSPPDGRESLSRHIVATEI